MDLNDLLTTHFRLLPHQKKALEKLGLHTVREILYHFPFRYENNGELETVSSLEKDKTVSLLGVLSSIKTKKTWKTKKAISEGVFEDGTGKIKLIWFHQPYIAKLFPEGSFVRISGKVNGKKESLYISNPDIQKDEKRERQESKNTLFYEEKEEEDFFGYYKESQGITSRWFRYALRKILKEIKNTPDPLPSSLCENIPLPSLEKSFHYIHFPKNENHIKLAKKRFAFEEIFILQIIRHSEKMLFQKNRPYTIENAEKEYAHFKTLLPFSLTESQENALETITQDLKKPYPMSRLLEGDVGSGKTAIAAGASYIVIEKNPKESPSARLQVCYMAPTEILAEQHFFSFITLFQKSGVRIGLLTGSKALVFPSKTDKNKPTRISKAQIHKMISGGEIAILIGTHSLTYDKVCFRFLGLVIVDEQHRFGTRQRSSLLKKNDYTPHFLSMTATPIPRTLALTLYGDLDITLVEGMPPGRKKIITELITPEKRKMVYEKMKELLQEGRQAYVICPRIEEPDPEKESALQTRSVIEEKKKLENGTLSLFRFGILHGKMTPQEKEKVMRDFIEKKYDILVATSVIEVGVNVPNATIILIEGAERFGLAQLHQLRGRVVRSTFQSYCFASSTSGTISPRLRAFKKADNGFKLAEKDLEIRGSGELFGKIQSGLNDMGMEALRNIKLVERARKEAQNILLKDFEIKKYPLLKEAVEYKKTKMHFE